MGDRRAACDADDALEYVRIAAETFRRMARGEGLAYDRQSFALMGNGLMAAADALEAALDGDGGDTRGGCRNLGRTPPADT